MFNEIEFEVQKLRSGKTNKDIADALGIDESTLYRKKKADGDFTRKEIEILVSFLNMENPIKVFFAPKLAETQD